MPRGKPKGTNTEDKGIEIKEGTKQLDTTDNKEVNNQLPTESVDTSINEEETKEEIKEETKQPDFSKKYTVINKEKANKKSLGMTGNLIEFDATGKAIVEVADAMHFSKIPGYIVKE